MLWVAALLSSLIWIIGWSSGFLGLRVHVFLLLAILAVLAACVPTRRGALEGEDGPDQADDPNAKSVPGLEDTDAEE